MTALQYHLVLTPVGRLRIGEYEAEDLIKPGAWIIKVAKAFSSCQAAGLFALAASNPDTPLSPCLSYWRDFASRYLSHLCRTAGSAEGRLEPIEAPSPAELSALREAAPPMLGGEYLNTELLYRFWVDLDDWVSKRIISSPSGLSGWIRKFAPVWQQVERVCFHLAENKNDGSWYELIQ